MSANKKSILILGGNGFVGRELGRHAAMLGYDITLLARRPDEIRGRLPFPCTILPWPTVSAPLPLEALANCDAVVNLIGEGVADKPWSESRRAAIRDSRVMSVAALVNAIAAASKRPSVVVQASAVGYYGDRHDDELDESAPPGAGFLADTCVQWEKAALALKANNVRLVTLRIGLVLGLTGGALPKLLGVYAKGLGAELGAGQQWTSWIDIDDLVRMILAAIREPAWEGVFNATAPEPCRNADFNAALARHGRYAAGKKAPAVAIRLAMGKRAALVLDSLRVLPKKAQRLGFSFRHQKIEAAISDLLGKAVEPNLRHLVVHQWIPIPVDRLWPFFSSAQNLERLTPPWLGFKVLRASDAEIRRGTMIDYRLTLHGLPISWRTEISAWDPLRMFVDEQRRGPYSVWHHTHTFESMAGGTLMTDAVQYRLRVAPLGELVAGLFVERDVQKIFEYRSRAVAHLGAQDFNGS